MTYRVRGRTATSVEVPNSSLKIICAGVYPDAFQSALKFAIVKAITIEYFLHKAQFRGSSGSLGVKVTRFAFLDVVLEFMSSSVSFLAFSGSSVGFDGIFSIVSIPSFARESENQLRLP